MTLNHHLTASIGLAIAATSLTARAEIEYEFFLVTSFNPTYQLAETYVVDINENNIAVGSDTFGGFIWTEANDKTQTPISGPRSINNLGYIAFNKDIYNSSTGQFTAIGSASAQYPNVSLRRINDDLLLVGVASYSGPSCEPFNCPFDCGASLIWTPGTGSFHITGVPGLKPLLGVNNQNVAIGMIITECDNNRAIVYDLNTNQWINLSDFLPPIPAVGRPAQTWPTCISDAGHVIGEATFGDEPPQEFIWTASAGFTFLPAIPNGDVSYMDANGVNIHGHVVGRALDDVNLEWKAFIWDAQRGTRDLNQLAVLPNNFIMNNAAQINDNGWIVGSGHFGPGWGTQRGFVLKPIPQPNIPADITGDGVVNVNDLLAVINSWGVCPALPSTCPADISPAPKGDGVVSVNDLLMVINNWG